MLHELLLPRTDRGVATQVAIVTLTLLGALVAVRRDAELRIFVVGLLVMAVALFGLRMLH